MSLGSGLTPLTFDEPILAEERTFHWKNIPVGDTKQVIVVRKDLNMRKGKIAAQASHASMSFMTRKITNNYGWKIEVDPDHSAEFQNWLRSFKKICVYVESEEELLALHEDCVGAGLVSHLITDSGLTEFHGVPTNTCIAVGPHWDSKFEGLIDTLPLL